MKLPTNIANINFNTETLEKIENHLLSLIVMVIFVSGVIEFVYHKRSINTENELLEKKKNRVDKYYNSWLETANFIIQYLIIELFKPEKSQAITENQKRISKYYNRFLSDSEYNHLNTDPKTKEQISNLIKGIFDCLIRILKAQHDLNSRGETITKITKICEALDSENSAIRLAIISIFDQRNEGVENGSILIRLGGELNVLSLSSLILATLDKNSLTDDQKIAIRPLLQNYITNRWGEIQKENGEY